MKQTTFNQGALAITAILGFSLLSIIGCKENPKNRDIKNHETGNQEIKSREIRCASEAAILGITDDGGAAIVTGQFYIRDGEILIFEAGKCFEVKLDTPAEVMEKAEMSILFVDIEPSSRTDGVKINNYFLEDGKKYYLDKDKKFIEIKN